MRNYSADEILEMSGWAPPGRAEVSVGSGGITGVSMPPDGVLLTSSAARALGAQLLMAADKHDEIFDAGYEACSKATNPEIQKLRMTLSEVMVWIQQVAFEEFTGLYTPREIINKISEALGIDPDDLDKET